MNDFNAILKEHENAEIYMRDEQLARSINNVHDREADDISRNFIKKEVKLTYEELMCRAQIVSKVDADFRQQQLVDENIDEKYDRGRPNDNDQAINQEIPIDYGNFETCVSQQCSSEFEAKQSRLEDELKRIDNMDNDLREDYVNMSAKEKLRANQQISSNQHVRRDIYEDLMGLVLSVDKATYDLPIDQEIPPVGDCCEDLPTHDQSRSEMESKTSLSLTDKKLIEMEKSRRVDSILNHGAAATIRLSVKDKLEKRWSDWDCTACTYTNGHFCDNCTICRTGRVQPASASQWKCPFCEHDNNICIKKCKCGFRL